jgi:hypothetical protein
MPVPSQKEYRIESTKRQLNADHTGDRKMEKEGSTTENKSSASKYVRRLLRTQREAAEKPFGTRTPSAADSAACSDKSMPMCSRQGQIAREEKKIEQCPTTMKHENNNRFTARKRGFVRAQSREMKKTLVSGRFIEGQRGSLTFEHLIPDS